MTAGVSGVSRTVEWRQFRLLSHDSIRQLLHAAVLSRSGDPMLFALWIVAIVATWPLVYSLRALMRYAGAPDDVSAAAVEFLVVSDRISFVLYAMMTAMLLAALTWESLFPNSTDQEAIGSLPVRPRTVAAARLAAALAMCTALAAAIAVPSGIVYGFIALMRPEAGFPPLVAATHVLVVSSGALFVFASLLACRALVALAAGATVADRLALLLQLVTVIGLLLVFMYLPTVVPFLVRQMADGPWAPLLPPTWFAALYGSMTGAAKTLDGLYAGWAGAALLGSLSAATLLYLAPARLMARRALESPSCQRASRLASLTRSIVTLLRLRPQVAGLFQFTVLSLARNPRHLVVIAGYLGVGIGIGVVFVLTAELRGLLLPIPQTASLTFPLVVIFLAVFGFRAAFNIPTDLAANWPFRLLEPAVSRAAAAARLAMLTLGILPIVALTMLAALAGGWTWPQVLAVGVFDLLSGALLVEIVLFGWPKIAFACAHPPDAGAVQVRWLLGLVGLNVFAARGADLQLAAIGSVRGTLIYTGVLLAAVIALRIAGHREARRLAIEFDGPPETSMQALNLSEALR